MTVLFKGGTVVSPTGADRAEVLVDGEKIAGVLAPDSDLALSAERGAEQVIDASGKYVIPGGVDCHTHLEMPVGDIMTADTFATGTQAAAWGGTTTVIDFATQMAGEQVRASLDARFAEAQGKCAIDYGFHMVLGDVNEASLKEMDALVAEGISSFKLFMAYPDRLLSTDRQLLLAMQQAAGNGAMIMMHAENGIAIDLLAEQAVERGETDPVNHGYVRRAELEAEATHRAIQLAKVGACPLYIVHLSSSEALEQVAWARAKGGNVFAETCPQYLYLNLEDHLGLPGFDGAKYVCSTPLRTKHEHHHHDLWHGLRRNDLSVISTDHCPFCMNEGKDAGVGDFRAIPNGIGGIEHRIDLIYQGVMQGEIGIERWVELCATTPARMFGLYPRKGIIAPGSDADIVVYDPAASWTISVDEHHMALDYSAYEGLELQGKVDTVMSRGQVLVTKGAFIGKTTSGQYLERGLSSYLI